MPKKSFPIEALPERYQKQIRAQLTKTAAAPSAPPPAVPEPKRGRIRVSKAVERTVDGIVFDSKMEAKLYRDLLGWIGKDAFSLQPKFCLQPAFADSKGKKHREIAYVGDFLIGPSWKEGEPLTEKHILIDVKGMLTEVYKLKRKLFLFRYQRPIIEVKKSSDLLRVLSEHGYATPAKP